VLSAIARGFVDRIAWPAVRRLRWRLGETTVDGLVQQRARERSAAYVEAHMPTAMIFSDAERFRAWAFSKRPSGGLILEFGVRQGAGVNLFASLTSEPVFGFDSFEGLKEDWGGALDSPAGRFTQQGRLPRVRPNVTLVKGWFHETLPGFLAEHPGAVSFVNVDSDTYEAAATVLSAIGPRLRAGSVILFDEYLGIPGWEQCEFRAWQEFVAGAGAAYQYLAFSDNRVALAVTALPQTGD
jgi:hypothetical protein